MFISHASGLKPCVLPICTSFTNVHIILALKCPSNHLQITRPKGQWGTGHASRWFLLTRLTARALHGFIRTSVFELPSLLYGLFWCFQQGVVRHGCHRFPSSLGRGCRDVRCTRQHVIPSPRTCIRLHACQPWQGQVSTTSPARAWNWHQRMQGTSIKTSPVRGLCLPIARLPAGANMERRSSRRLDVTSVMPSRLPEIDAQVLGPNYCDEIPCW